tara:strand:+ start:145 stop:453 length:309 start_codon:yes stop_codon:yes gene_type:complete
MVKVTNLTNKLIRRRLPTGVVLQFRPNEPVEVTSERLIKEIQNQVWAKVGGTPQVGGGLKTGSKPAKRRGRPPKAKAVQEKVDKLLKEPPKKGLKSKKGKAK